MSPDHRRFVLCAGLTVAVATGWLSAVAALARTGVAFELLLLALPLVAWLGGGLRFADRRLHALVLIQTGFLLACVAGELALAHGTPAVHQVARWGVLVYFVVQGVGFVAYQVKRRHPIGVLQTLLGTAMLVGWWAGPGGLGALSPDGAYWALGAEMPWQVQVTYIAWALNPLLVQSAELPRMGQALVQLASIGVALASGAFLHVRILTACHAMTVDLMFGYGRRASDGAVARALTLPPPWRAFVEGPLATWLPRLTLATLAAMAGQVLLFGF